MLGLNLVPVHCSIALPVRRPWSFICVWWCWTLAEKKSKIRTQVRICVITPQIRNTASCVKCYVRSSQVVRASDCQYRSPNSPGFHPSILRHSGIWGEADEAVLNKVHRRKKIQKFPLFFFKCYAEENFVQRNLSGLRNLKRRRMRPKPAAMPAPETAVEAASGIAVVWMLPNCRKRYRKSFASLRIYWTKLRHGNFWFSLFDLLNFLFHHVLIPTDWPPYPWLNLLQKRAFFTSVKDSNPDPRGAALIWSAGYGFRI